jgi:hypothetical protein
MFIGAVPTSRPPAPGSVDREDPEALPFLVSLLLALPPSRDRPPPLPRRDFLLIRPAVLIFSADVVAAALLGAVVDLAGHDPCFPRPDESPREALLRVRPRLAVIDCDHEEACSESFVGPALMTGALILLVAPDNRRHDGAVIAERLGLTVIGMPSDHERLVRCLDGLRAD